MDDFKGIFDMPLIERPRRPYAQFLEEEIILPNGPYAGRPWSFDFQPYTRHIANAIDSWNYNRFAFSGPTQSGKTLICVVAPDCWTMFDLEETVVCGLPNMDMAADKWEQDFLPIIMASRYRTLLPNIGSGSRAGRKLISITFKNGVTLRFMGAGGNDKQRSAFTTPHLSMTEINGYDESSKKSKEADKVKQMEGRVLAYRRSGKYRILMECTQTNSEGRINEEIDGGTKSYMKLLCPHCTEYMIIDREDLRGWQECATENQAKDESYFECPICKDRLYDKERDKANRNSKCINTKEALTFSFNWTGANNLFMGVGDLGVAEWKAKFEATDKENAEKELCQFYWGRAYDADNKDSELVIDLDSVTASIDEAGSRMARGLVPSWTKYITYGTDVHAKLLFWVLTAWGEDGNGHIIDYGKHENPYKEHGQEQAVKIGLGELDRYVLIPWQVLGESRQLPVTFGLKDASWLPDIVRATCSANVYPIRGIGTTQNFKKLRRAYRVPERSDKDTHIKYVGDGYHLVRFAPKGQRPYMLYEHDVDYGKSWIHARFATPADAVGRLTIFDSDEPDGHAEFWSHIKAELQVIEKGATVWRTRSELKAKKDPRYKDASDVNHWLDATVLTGTAYRILKAAKESQKRRPPSGTTETKQIQVQDLRSIK